MKLSTFHITIDDSRLKFKSHNHEDMFRRYLAQFEGKEVMLELSEKKAKRSGQQNNYMWLYFSIISDDTGFTQNEIHTWAKGKFLTEGIKEVFGDNTRIIKSTADLKVGEFINYLMQIAEEVGIPLPDTTDFLGYSYHK